MSCIQNIYVCVGGGGGEGGGDNSVWRSSAMGWQHAHVLVAVGDQPAALKLWS